MSDDEDDYMSDKLLPSSCDIKPGLIRTNQEKRDLEQYKRKIVKDQLNRDRFKPYKVIEEERRKDGMSNKLSSDNKGFAMLMKMGYKSGEALGKNGEGRLDPIAIDVKTDKRGLGLNAALKEIAEKKAAIRQRHIEKCNEELNSDTYRQKISEKFKEGRVRADLFKSRNVCYDFDQKQGWTKPIERWYWPENVAVVDSDDEKTSQDDENLDKDEPNKPTDGSDHDSESICDVQDDFEYADTEKLEILTVYLRKTYNYCIWCGVVYNDQSDLEQNCPGSTRDDH